MLCKLPWMVRDVGTLVAKRLVTLTWIPKTLLTQTSLCPFLHTFLYTFLKVLEKNVFLTIKSFFSWWSFPLFSWPQCLIQGWYCKEIYFLFFKLDSLHFSVYLNPSFERFFFFPEKRLVRINKILPSSIELRNNSNATRPCVPCVPWFTGPSC